MNGFVNLLKPPGMTSSDAVVQVRRLLDRGTRIGHGGTLDPDAAGVLPICVGKATRLFDYIIDKRKTYIAEMRLGLRTDTDDAAGRIVSSSPVNACMEDVQAALCDFTGDIMQVPPVYSALKRDGEALYKKARKGETVLLEPRPVKVHSLELLCRLSPERYMLKIVCGKGVYIRALLRDIGEKLNCGAHMAFLLRSESGAFDVNSACTLEELKSKEDIERALCPLDFPLGAYPQISVRAEYRKNLLDGQLLRAEWLTQETDRTKGALRVYLEGEFAGMGEWTEQGVQMKCMLLDREG